MDLANCRALDRFAEAGIRDGTAKVDGVDLRLGELVRGAMIADEKLYVQVEGCFGD